MHHLLPSSLHPVLRAQALDETRLLSPGQAGRDRHSRRWMVLKHRPLAFGSGPIWGGQGVLSRSVPLLAAWVPGVSAEVRMR